MITNNERNPQAQAEKDLRTSRGQKGIRGKGRLNKYIRQIEKDKAEARMLINSTCLERESYSIQNCYDQAYIISKLTSAP